MRIVLSLPLPLLFACATPIRYAEGEYVKYDKTTKYNIEEHDDGFTLSILYSRYQLIPESDAAAAAGKGALMAIAYEIGESKSKQIEPVNEQRIKSSMGRNGFTGITSWSGSVRCFYKTP